MLWSGRRRYRESRELRSIRILIISGWNYSLPPLDNGLLHGHGSMHAVELVVKACMLVRLSAGAKAKLVALTTSIAYRSAAFVPAPQRRDRCTTILTRKDEASGGLVDAE